MNEMIISGEMFTKEELAVKFGITLDGMAKRIAKLGIEPVKQANAKAGIAAKYDYNALIKIQDEDSILKAKQVESDAKAVDKLKDNQRPLVIEQAFDNASKQELVACSHTNGHDAIVWPRDILDRLSSGMLEDRSTVALFS
jgi:hypothetical protein